MIADLRSEAPITATQVALAATGLAIAYIVITAFILPFLSHQGKYWSTQSWVGLQKQWFARYRAGANAVKNTRTMVTEGYEKFSRNNKAFVLPQFSTRPLLILPANKLNELLSLPDDRVDALLPNQESIATEYTVGSDISHGPHIDIVRRQLTRRLPLLTTDVYEELVFSMKDNWNANENDWTTVKAYDTCQKIVSRAANRVFAGTELCRTLEFLEHSRLYAVSVFRTGGIMRLFPKPLHPIIAPIFQREIRKHLNICKKLSLPVIRERLAHIQDPQKDPNYKAPADALQWMLEDLNELAKKDPSELDEHKIVRRLLLLNMVAIHTTSMVTTNTLLDLYSSPDKEEYVSGLREEVERVLRESGGEWTKNAINSMYRIDSAIRESMRYSDLGDVGMRREVIDPKGIDLSGGLHIPYGVRIAAPNHTIHRDSAFYGDNANEWDAFRFSRPREAYLQDVQAAGGDADRLDRVLEQKNQGLIATGADFLSFGHGRHSCPGRFFASQEMKLMLVHIVMNYDIEVVGGERPPNMLMNGACIPSQTAELRVKLRSGKAQSSMVCEEK